MAEFAKTLIFVGLTLTFIGGGLFLLGKIPGWSKLPGDIIIKKENYSFYFPITTCIIISLIVSVGIYLWNHR